MNCIPSNTPLNGSAAPPSAVARNFQLTRSLPRVAVGLTAALAGASAAFLVFGPLSNLSALQPASAPRAPATGSDGKPIVLFRSAEATSSLQAAK